MLTKKVVVDQFVVEYQGSFQNVSYLETTNIYEDGVFLGKLATNRKQMPITDANSLYSGISLGAWVLEDSYSQGDVVSHIDKYWQASQASIGEEPSDVSAFWTALPVPSEVDSIVDGIKKVSSFYVRDIVTDENSTPEELSRVAEIVPSWAEWKKYYRDDIVSRSGEFYQAIIEHTSQPTWVPETSYSLWKKIHLGETVPAWTQPLGAHDAYPAGFRVTHNSITWVSNVDNNVWEPGVSGWTDESTITGEPTAQEWVQPTGAQDAYPLDAVVTHNGLTWVSIVSNNVWEPGVYGWNEVV